MLKRTWKKAKKIEEERDAAKKIGAVQWKDCQRPKKGKVLKVVLNYLRKKWKSSGGDTTAYLREKAEKHFKLREELKLRREEPELNKQREQLLLAQSGAMIQLMNKLAEKF